MFAFQFILICKILTTRITFGIFLGYVSFHFNAMCWALLIRYLLVTRHDMYFSHEPGNTDESFSLSSYFLFGTSLFLYIFQSSALSNMVFKVFSNTFCRLKMLTNVREWNTMIINQTFNMCRRFFVGFLTHYVECSFDV